MKNKVLVLVIASTLLVGCSGTPTKSKSENSSSIDFSSNAIQSSEHSSSNNNTSSASSSSVTQSSIAHSSSVTSSSSSSTISPMEKANFKTRNVAVRRKANEIDKTISLRFYEGMEHVPYIAVSTYYKEFFNTDLVVEQKSHTYSYKKKKSLEDYLAFDAEQDLFMSNNIDNFHNHPDFKEATGKLFIDLDKQVKSPKTDRVVDLKNYDIPVYEGNKEAYVPLTFLSQIAGGFQMYNIAYNGKDIYVLDNEAQLVDEARNTTYFADTYFELLSKMDEEREEDLAKYSYNELCFVFDNLRGYTSQLIIGDNNLLTLGLNGVLETYYPELKEYLLSEDKEKYYIGFNALFSGLFDGGHTVSLSDFNEFKAATNLEVDEPFNILNVKQKEAINQSGIVALSTSLSKTLAAQPTGTLPGFRGRTAYAYSSEYKTAYIGFASFDVDVTGWDNYYKGQGEVPVSTDTYAFVRSKFYQAMEDGAENVVLDLTSNGGGNTGALCGLIGLVNGAKSSFSITSSFNKYRTTDQYTVDINLDGKYDKEDEIEASRFNFNIGVLTSAYSFSCANLFPSMMKELGYKIMGERSRGGSCAVYRTSTAEGLEYVHSSHIGLSDQYGNDIDAGVPVDFEIPVTQSAITPTALDYGKFFDSSITGTYLSTAYNN